MNPVFLSDSVYLHFGTTAASTGAATNADSTPVVSIEEDGVLMGYAPSVTNIATGLYRVQIDATAGNGFESGKRYSVYVTATVVLITGRDGIGEFEVLTTDLDTVSSRIDAATTTRMATYTQPTGFLAATFPAGTIANQTNLTAGTIDSVTGSVGSVVGLTASNLDTTISSRLATASYTAPDNATIGAIAGYVDTEVAAIKAKTDQLTFTVANQVDANALTVGDKTGYRLSSAGVDDMLRTALTESYATDGAAPTLSQFLYMVHSELAEFSIAGTTITCKKLDGSTTSMTYTIDSATDPTSRTRAS